MDVQPKTVIIENRRKHRVEVCRKALKIWNFGIFQGLADGVLAADRLGIDPEIPALFADNREALSVLARCPNLVLHIPAQAWRNAVAVSESDAFAESITTHAWGNSLYRLVTLITHIMPRDLYLAARLTGLHREELEQLELAAPHQVAGHLLEQPIGLRYNNPEKWRLLLQQAAMGSELVQKHGAEEPTFLQLSLR